MNIEEIIHERKVRKILIGSVIVLIIVFVFLFLFVQTLRYKVNRKVSVNELVLSDTTIRIKDTGLLKKIVLDSLSLVTGVYADMKSINIDRNDALEKIHSFQDYTISELSTTLGNEFLAQEKSKIFTPLRLLTGERELSQSEAATLTTLLKLKSADQTRYITINGVNLNPTSPALDIRKFGIVPTVGDQGADGTCWAFAAAGAYEINYGLVKGKNITTSEQQILDCSEIANERGGLAYKVFEWMGPGKKNLADIGTYPYTGILGRCTNATPMTDYYAKDWRLLNSNPFAKASIAEIKDAICKFGAVVSSVYVTDKWKGMPEATSSDRYIDHNTYREPNNDLSSNHSVVIIGWDDGKQAWLVKNSWGENWGSTCGYGNTRGYLWLDYGSCNIGKRAAWVLAR